MKFIYSIFVLSVAVALSAFGEEALSRESSRTEHRHPRHQEEKETDIWSCECLTGDWGGLRKDLSEKGVEFSAVYIGEVLSNLSGGLRRGTAYEGLLDLGLDLHLEKLVEWKGGLFHINSYWMHGSSPTAKYVGDLQTISNIDAFDALRLNELWYQQSFWNDKFSIRLGQLAVDKEFMISDYGGLFLNAAFGWPVYVASNVSSPAYPMSAPGIRFRWDPYEECYFQATVCDGDPTAQRLNVSGTHINFHDADGRFGIYEFGYKHNQSEGSKGLPGTYKLGIWQHTDSFVDRVRGTDGLSLADPSTNGQAVLHQGNYGIYGVIDQMIWRESKEDLKSDQGLGIFFRGGDSLDDRSLIALQLMGGANYKGAIPGRDEDVVGLGVTHAEISNSVRKFDADTNQFNGATAPTREYETAIEFTYRTTIAPWWVVQPDFQWILNPGGSSAIGDAVVVGIRSNIVF